MQTICRKSLILASALLLSGCAMTSRIATAGASAGSCADWKDTSSKPGKEWWAEQRWRFQSDDDARKAYASLVNGMSPWPDWYTPQSAELAPGTRVQMAISADQSVDRPGGFATFDNIGHAQDVYDYLAVKKAWKPSVAFVVTYEVIKPLPVNIGPIGPQVDEGQCRLLPGRWSQVEMRVPPTERMTYLRVVDKRPVQ